MRFRLLNMLYAHATAHFWLPCPLCGQMFGGHEWKDGNDIPTGEPGTGMGICPDCGNRGE